VPDAWPGQERSPGDGPCFHLFPPEEREESLAKLRQAEKAAFRVEVQLLRADGMILPVQLAPVRIHPRDGIDYQLTFVTNLALIKEQEHTLRLFCRAIEQSGIAIIITDSQGKIEYVNHRFTQITGYTQEEALGQTPRILKSGEHPPEFYEGMWATILSGKRWQGPIVNKRKDGKLYWEEMTIAPMFDDRGRISHFIAVKDEISERIRHHIKAAAFPS